MKQPELFNPFGAYMLSHEVPEQVFTPLVQKVEEVKIKLSDKEFVLNNSHDDYLSGKNSYQIKLTPEELSELGLDNYLLSLGDYYLRSHHQQQNLQMGSVWINYGYEGDINPIHTHDALLSGVIYIKQDQAIFDEMKDFTGRNAHGCPGATHFVYSVENHRFNRNFFTNTTNPGHLCMFPSWLPHYVNPHRNFAERIGVAFNILEA